MKPGEIPPPANQVPDFLEDAIAHMESYARAQLGAADFAVAAALATDLVTTRLAIVSGRENAYDILVRHQPGVDVDRLRRIVSDYAQQPNEWPPWVRFIVELILVERGIDRSLHALERYADLRATVAGREVPSEAWFYLQEVVDSYLFGFDTAAVTLACGCFEVLAKRALLSTGKVTQPQLDREKPGAEMLRSRLRQWEMLSDTTARSVAELIEVRNALLHGSNVERPAKELSIGAIRTLVQVCTQLQPAWQSRG